MSSKDTDKTQMTLDTSGAALSLLCALHCLLLPTLITLAPSLKLGWLAQGWVHITILVLVVPVVIAALWRGYSQHKDYTALVVGGLGLLSLVAAVVVGHALHIEGTLTLIGSIMLIAAHTINYIMCRKHCEQNKVSAGAA